MNEHVWIRDSFAFVIHMKEYVYKWSYERTHFLYVVRMFSYVIQMKLKEHSIRDSYERICLQTWLIETWSFVPKRDGFADLTGIRDFREIYKKKKIHGEVSRKISWWQAERVQFTKGKTTKRKMSGVQYSQFQAVASKILQIKWFPGQNSIRRKRQILGMHAK